MAVMYFIRIRTHRNIPHMCQRWTLNKWTSVRIRTNYTDTHTQLCIFTWEYCVNSENLWRANLPQSCAHFLRFQTLSDSIQNENDFSRWLCDSKSKIHYHHHSSVEREGEREREEENGDFQSINQYAYMHAIVQVTLHDTIGKRIDLFSMLIELYESWLAFETSALMCNDVQSLKNVAVIHSA